MGYICHRCGLNEPCWAIGTFFRCPRCGYPKYAMGAMPHEDPPWFGDEPKPIPYPQMPYPLCDFTPVPDGDEGK